MKKTKIVCILGVVCFVCILVVSALFAGGKESASDSKNGVVSEQNFYKVQIKLNEGISKPAPYSFDGNYGSSMLGNYIVDVLQLAKPTSMMSFRDVITAILYDSTEESPYGNNNNRFNHEFFISLKPGVGTIDVGRAYTTKEFTIQVSSVDNKLVPYLLDAGYCELDTDCAVSSNFCQYASFNKFRQYVDIWGCEETFHPQEDEKKLRAMCAPNEFPVIKYTGSKCISNKCVAQNMKLETCRDLISM